VGLDGSPIAERPLPLLGAVCIGVEDGSHNVHTLGSDAKHRDMRAAAEAYVQRHAIELERRKVRASTAMACDHPAEFLLESVDSTDSNLIARTTGRSGVKRWLLGSVAEKVMRASQVPVLLVRGDA